MSQQADRSADKIAEELFDTMQWLANSKNDMAMVLISVDKLWENTSLVIMHPFEIAVSGNHRFVAYVDNDGTCISFPIEWISSIGTAG